MNALLLFAAMQIAPPVIDPILEPTREPPPAVQAAPPSPDPRLGRCASLADTDPQAALAEGARWLLENGGIDAEQCLAFGYLASGQWSEATEAFVRAAALAETADDARLPLIFAQAGNAALAGDDAASAKLHFDRALAIETTPSPFRGQTLIDRARAHVQLGDGDAAQADLLAAQAIVPDEPMVWLFSATLARLQGDLDAADEFIDRALELDQQDAAIMLEAGNIALTLNAPEIAREAWTRAMALDPGGPAGEAATQSVAGLDARLAENAPIEIRETPEAATAPEVAQPDPQAPESHR